MNSDIQEYLRYSPFTALLEGRDEIAQAEIVVLFSAMSDAERELLASDESGRTIQGWETSGLVPPGYGPAIAKLIGLIAFGEVAINSVEEILTRLGVTPAQLPSALGVVTSFLHPLLEPPTVEPLTSLEQIEIPPLTHLLQGVQQESAPISAPLPPRPPSTSTPSRNTIDLRNKPLA